MRWRPSPNGPIHGYGGETSGEKQAREVHVHGWMFGQWGNVDKGLRWGPNPTTHVVRCVCRLTWSERGWPTSTDGAMIDGDWRWGHMQLMKQENLEWMEDRVDTLMGWCDLFFFFSFAWWENIVHLFCIFMCPVLASFMSFQTDLIS